MEKLRIVVLDPPYDTWTNPLTADFLKDLIGLKLRGYGCEYPYGVLAVDGNDLISTHLTICRVEENETLKPLMGIRWTSLKKSRLHYSNFPGMSLLQQSGSNDHVKALESIIRDVDENGRDLFYSGSLSIDPSERGNKERSIYFRELLTMMYVYYQKESGYAELMAGGTVRFKIDKWLESLGHSPLSKGEIELGEIKVKHLAGETVRIMHLKEFSFEALRIAKKWSHMWENRLVISTLDDIKKLKTG